MNSLSSVDPETILSGTSDWIGPDVLERLSEHPLDCIETEFPHVAPAIESPEAPERPAERHPVFYGCFDWHSSVHSHWSLVRQLRLFDDHPVADDVVSSLARRFTAENVEREVDYLDENESFEKPYGWAWLLRLVSELRLWDADRADEWRAALEPLETLVVDRVESEFLTQSRPFRVGTHQNSAFALQCILDYARVVSDHPLESAACSTARRFFGEDTDYPVEYEPLGWDFLSPALAEADLMRRVLDEDEFPTWLDGFLPDVTEPPYDAVLEPVSATADTGGGVELHLVGLNLAKAWSLKGVASALDGGYFVEAFVESAQRHAERGLESAFTDEYAGSHWLSSFALYLLTTDEGAIAPSR